MAELASTSSPSFDLIAEGALGDAVDSAVLAPSLHNSQPWSFRLHPAVRPRRLDVLVDRSRHLRAIDPTGRALVQSVGAALFNARVSLAAAGWATSTCRLPDAGDPDLMAVVQLEDGPPDSDLAALNEVVGLRHTNRRSFAPGAPGVGEVAGLLAAARAEDAQLVPVLGDEQHRLLARLTQVADGRQHQDPAYRAELRRWTNRPAAAGDGIVPAAVPHVDGTAREDLPVRDFDTRGDGALPPSTGDGAEGTLVLLTTVRDDEEAWLRSGEALQRVLLEVTRAGWVASPLTQALEDAQTRQELRSALTWDRWPQSVLRIGRAPLTPGTPRRPRPEVVAEDPPA
ncbi:MAG: hypothetical protein JWQ53_1316 [Klenkia sp.]|nr:hypothetical protein [Klenkia sp.]